MKLQHPISGQDDIFVVGLALPKEPGSELRTNLQQLGYQVILMSNAEDVARLVSEGYFDALVYDPELKGSDNLMDTASTHMFPFSCISTAERIFGEICSEVEAAHGRFVFPRTV